MQQALKRLSPKEAYDRVFRMRRAFQVWRWNPPVEDMGHIMGGQVADRARNSAPSLTSFCRSPSGPRRTT